MGIIAFRIDEALAKRVKRGEVRVDRIRIKGQKEGVPLSCMGLILLGVSLCHAPFIIYPGSRDAAIGTLISIMVPVVPVYIYCYIKGLIQPPPPNLIYLPADQCLMYQTNDTAWTSMGEPVADKSKVGEVSLFTTEEFTRFPNKRSSRTTPAT